MMFEEHMLSIMLLHIEHISTVTKGPGTCESKGVWLYNVFWLASCQVMVMLLSLIEDYGYTFPHMWLNILTNQCNKDLTPFCKCLVVFVPWGCRHFWQGTIFVSIHFVIYIKTIFHNMETNYYWHYLITFIIICGMKLLIHFQTSTVQPLKFGNGVILILAGIKVKPC